MPILHLVLVALIQGITEFLPISSSAHLILLPNLTGLQDQGQIIDVSVHLGTLIAVVTYFWRDVRFGLSGIPNLVRGRLNTDQSRLALNLIIATIPAMAFGLVLKLSGIDEVMRGSVALIGATMLGFGIVLWWADTKSVETTSKSEWSLTQAWKLGLWQAVALIPGTSRSGITITGARFMGFTRKDAATISMLMSIPTIIAAGALEAIDVAKTANTAVLIDGAIAAAFAAVSAFIALGLMMRLLRSVSFTPYVIYRVIFGAGLIIWAMV